MRKGQGTPRHTAMTEATPITNTETAGGMSTLGITEIGIPLLTGGVLSCQASTASIVVMITNV